MAKLTLKSVAFLSEGAEPVSRMAELWLVTCNLIYFVQKALAIIVLLRLFYSRMRNAWGYSIVEVEGRKQLKSGCNERP